jgi:glycosyltransferase involved in cell wall biosynthesis
MSEIAYVLKAYPRLSETFITSEIHRLEEAGQKLHLFSIKQVEAWEAVSRYPVVERIRARPTYLPKTTTLDEAELVPWLRTNVPAFLPAIRYLARRRPLGLAKGIAAGVAQGMRARKHLLTSPIRKVFLKDLLFAIAVAEGCVRHPEIGHIHAHYAHGTTTVAWLAGKITGLPFSFTAHAKDIYDDTLNPGGLLRRKLLAAEFAVTCTEANAEHLRAIAPEATIHRVYHGLVDDVQRFVEGEPARVERNGRLRVLGVGRLVPKKGFDVLVEACAELDRRGVPFEARIVGPDGAHGDEVRRLIAEHGLADRVALPGRMDQDALCEEYVRADALCQPSRLLEKDRDGIPNVLVEAMACGVPVVATAVSGIPELVHHDLNGLLIDPDDPVALADALQRLHDDRELAARLARAGEATVQERFDGDRLAHDLVDLFAARAR